MFFRILFKIQTFRTLLVNMKKVNFTYKNRKLKIYKNLKFRNFKQVKRRNENENSQVDHLRKRINYELMSNPCVSIMWVTWKCSFQFQFSQR